MSLLEQFGLKDWKGLLALVRRQYEPVFAGRKRVCLVGPVNTGKSSLYNALVGEGEPQAAVSPVPGTTRRTMTGDAEAFWVVDTPGANEAAVGDEGARACAERRQEAYAAAWKADLIVFVFDAARGIGEDELAIYRALTTLGHPFVVALNKVDLVRGAQKPVAEAAARCLGLEPAQVIPISATRRMNLGKLLAAVVEADPQLLATLSAALPAYRWTLANRTILSACTAAGTANVLTSPVSIPFASFVPITAIQVAMVLNLARVFGQRLSAARAKELALTLGSGLLGRSLFYHLADLVPVAGWMLGTAVASATTMALGYSVALWFAYGERPSAETVQRLSESAARSLVQGVRGRREGVSRRRAVELAVRETMGRIAELAAQGRSGHARHGEAIDWEGKVPSEPPLRHGNNLP